MRKGVVLLLLISMMISVCGCSFPVNKDADHTDNPAGFTGAADSVGTADSAGTSGSGDAAGMDGTAGQNGKSAADGTQPVKPLNPDDGKANEGSSAREVGRLAVTLYYQDREGCLIPVTRRIVKQEGIAKASICCLVDSALIREEISYFGLYPVLPKGTEILGMNIKEGTATVDFNEKFLDYRDEAGERNAVCSVVYTLTGFKTVENVRILVKGHKKGKLKYGTDISGVLDRGNILVNQDRVNLEEGLGKSDIYIFKRVKDAYAYILPVSKEHGAEPEEEKPYRIVELLDEQLGDENLYSEIPHGVRLLQASIKDRTLILVFDEELLDYGGRAREDGIVSQLLYSMAQVEDVEKVKILIEGRAAELPEGTDISKSLPIPAEINDYIDSKTQ